MAERIHTSKVLNNSYLSGDNQGVNFSTGTIAVSPAVSDRYDFALTDDIVLLNERKDTAELLYVIYKESPWADTDVKKIPKEQIKDIFYYTKEKLDEKKKLSAYEIVIAINEFYEFNYDYIVNKVLSPKMTAEILDDYYQNMGMKKRMDECASEQLF